MEEECRYENIYEKERTYQEDRQLKYESFELPLKQCRYDQSLIQQQQQPNSFHS
jgi:hypothetical protein